MPRDADPDATPQNGDSEPHDGLAPQLRRGQRGADRDSSTGDQTAADLDQTAADLDQTASDLDQTGSQLDQLGADADQVASDLDQVAANREYEGHAETHDQDWLEAHERSRVERERTTRERGRTAAIRERTATQRLEFAARRDEAARMRDVAAEARDRAAEARDAAALQIEAELAEDSSARLVYGHAMAVRAFAAADRARAAADRVRAAHDREQAATDLKRAEAEIEHAHLDELTGAYARGAGTLALQREVDRARHSDERLVVAFVDIDEFKQVNDRLGHGGGDTALRDVVGAMRSRLRSYDPVVRVGGDEFICAVSGVDLQMGHARFAQIGAALEGEKGISISVGLTALQRGETLEELTARGDAALYAVKREHEAARADGSPWGRD